MTTDWDAIVIGAGPAGSVAARQLAIAGRRVLLLDKKRFPRRKVCAACFHHSVAAGQISVLKPSGRTARSSGGISLSGVERIR